MMELDQPIFTSVEDECRYWKERAKQYHKEWTDIKQDYDEFVEQSRQIEAEMDAQFDQKNAVIKELRYKVASLEKENESLKVKVESHTIELANVEKQLDAVKKDRDSMKEYMRQLEQKNDDLERAHRILNESIVDFEKMLDKAYEKNALLEMEVDEKEVLQEKLQRLMDETRDLKQELNVKSRYPANSSTANISINSANSTVPNGIVTSNGDLRSIEALNATTPTTTNLNELNQQRSLKNPDNLSNGNTMTASSRTTALNIVADMLRKLNLDKTLLCPECDKFRCICDRTTPTSACYSAPSNQTQSVSQSQSNVSCRNSRSFTSPFGGSSHSVTSTASTATANTPATPSSSRSNSSLNFGTNIFKRFAERMSANSTPTANCSALATPTATTHVRTSDDQ